MFPLFDFVLNTYKMKVVLIIGNGFDLDLGWQTQFSHFAKSSFWPPKPSQYTRMYDYLNTRRTIYQWFDLERIFAEYVNPNSGVTSKRYASNDAPFFQILSHSLGRYLAGEQEKPIREGSVAGRVLSAVLSVSSFAKIYTFNYTDLRLIASKLGLKTGFVYEHVHGNISDDSVILGIQDDADVCEGYEFLYKTFNKYYSSHEILFDLLDADEVIFFGHSLGKTDYHYFQRFFQMQCRSDMKRREGKKITIFTYDYASRISTLKQLRSMNNKRTDLLFNQNELNIFMTDGSDDEKINVFLAELSKRVKNDNKKQVLRSISEGIQMRFLPQL